ncbi:MAG: hypothetical protein ACHQYQ_02635 [Bacteriovoracales bacterium]
MRFFIIFSFCLGVYAQDGLKRLEQELKFLENRETFLYLPKKEMLSENSDQVKTTSSSILKTSNFVSQEELLRELEEEAGFKEEPINASEGH